MNYATNCLSATGFNPGGFIVAIIVLLIVGFSLLWVRKSLAKSMTMIVIFGLLFAGLSVAQSAPARASGSCTPSASSTPELPPMAPPVINNLVSTFNADSPFTVTAGSEGPVEFHIFTFTYLQYTHSGWTLNPSTGVMTPPTGAARNAACVNDLANAWLGNTTTGITFTVVAHNRGGDDVHDFTIDDHVYCATVSGG